MQNPNHMISKNIVYDEIAMALENKNLQRDEIDKLQMKFLKFVT